MLPPRDWKDQAVFRDQVRKRRISHIW
ncbi:hypothetical protein LINPERPRIM_LOCUS31618 [Linum perenne]